MTEGPRHGEVWWADLEPVVGSEANKTRPVVIVGAPEFERIPLRLVMPCTTWQSRFERHLNKAALPPSDANGFSADSAADALQLRSRSLDRFEFKVGVLNADELAAVMKAVALVTGLDPELVGGST